jgi:hypothetical protein
MLRIQPIQPPSVQRRGSARGWPLPGIFGQVRLPEAPDQMRAGIVDVSETGVGLTMSRPIAPETALEVTLVNAPGLFACTRTAFVRYVRSGVAGGFHIGCEFDTPLGHGELTCLQA